MNKWKQSKNDKLWFYKPSENPTPSRNTIGTINAVSNNGGFKIFHSGFGGGNYKLIGEAKTEKESLSKIKRYIRSNPKDL